MDMLSLVLCRFKIVEVVKLFSQEKRRLVSSKFHHAPSRTRKSESGITEIVQVARGDWIIIGWSLKSSEEFDRFTHSGIAQVLMGNSKTRKRLN